MVKSIASLNIDIASKATQQHETSLAITKSHEVMVTKRKKSIRPQELDPLKSAAKENAIINNN